MTASWWELTEADRKEAIAFSSSTLGRPSHVIEKDLWVVWALQQLFSSPFGQSITFKGGTSLSKVFRVISRFSEDIDLTVNILDFLPADVVGDDPIPVSRNQVKRIRKAIDTQLPEWLDSVVVPLLSERIQETNHPATVVRPTGSLDTVNIEYGPVFRGGGYLLPRVKLEFGARTTGLPRSKHRVTADMSVAIPSVVLPVADVFVLSAERTFWEKATAIHVFCSQARLLADRFSRHWSDVVALWHCGHGPSAVGDRALARDVALVKEAFYPAKDKRGYPVDYHRAVSGEISLLPDAVQKEQLRHDYEAMESDGLLNTDSLPFDDVINAISDIEKNINRHTGETKTPLPVT